MSGTLSTPPQARTTSEATRLTDKGAGTGVAAPLQPAFEEPKLPADPRLREMRVIRGLLIALVTLGALVVTYFSAAVLVPLVAALLLAMLFKPLVRRLEKWRIGPPVSAGLIVGTLTVAALLGAGAMFDSLQAWVADAPRAMGELKDKFGEMSASLRRVSEATREFEEITAPAPPKPAGDEAEPVKVEEPVRVEVRQPSSLPAGAINITTTVVAGLVVILVTTYFLLASGDLFVRQLVQALPNLSDKKEAVAAVRDLESQVSSYLVTVTLINAGLAAVSWGVFMAIGLPHAVWWAITGGVMNYVPYLGALATAGALFCAGLLAYDTVGQALLPPAMYVMLTTLEGYLITPTILGRRLELNPLILFLGLTFWGWMWGIPGALMAVPMLICFKIVCEHVQKLSGVAALLAGDVRKPDEDNGGKEAVKT